MSRARTALVFVFLLAAWGFSGLLASAADTLPVLRRKLLEARTEEQVNQALFDLSETIGKPDYFPDHLAFAEWLVALPDGRPEHRLVRQRIGWAYILAKKGEKGVAALEAASKDDPSNGLTRAYLGEALRQAGRNEDAATMLAAAVKCGERGTFVHDAIVATIIQAQGAEIPGHADDLPLYVKAGETYLAVMPDARIHQMLADMLLKDFKTFEKPDRKRGQLWAQVAGKHLLAAIEGSTQKLANADQMAYDAAVALAVADRESKGDTLRFDLLAQAYILGRSPSDGTHARPQVLTWLAEAAAQEGRFELAYKLATERLEISDSARARRLLMRLPPDLGRDE